MIQTVRARLLVVGLLLLGHAILFPLYAQQPVNPDAWVLPRSSEFLVNPELYLNERVVTGGIVESTDPIQFRVSDELLTVTGTNLVAAAGDKLRVYGTLVEPQTVRAIHAFVVPRSGLLYTWGISFVAGLWTLGRLLKHWQVDYRTLGFSPRDSPLTLRTLREKLNTIFGDSDA